MTEQAPFFMIISTDEFREKKEDFPHYKELLHNLGGIYSLLQGRDICRLRFGNHKSSTEK